MARYKVLKSVAHSFGHSFSSLMNYRDDDYVMGHLLRTARETGEPKLKVNILTADAGPDALLIPPVRSSIEDRCKHFGRLVESHGSSLAVVAAATMEITFDLEQRRAVRHAPQFEESPYTCRVEITDDRGKVWVAELRDWWYPESGGVIDPPLQRLRATTITRLGQAIRSVWRAR